MKTRESMDSRVLRWSGFSVAAFVVGVMLIGFAQGPSKPVAVAQCHESELGAGQPGCELAVHTERR
jgi:hypothetical protein